MSKRILVVSKSGPDSWWKSTILARSDCEVTFTGDYANAHQVIRLSNCDLVVIEEWPSDTHLSDFLESLRHSVSLDSPAALVITSSEIPSLAAHPVKKVLVPPVRPAEFNDAVALLLGLPTRANSRYLVRVHLSVTSNFEDMSIVATVATVNISSSGMLVESMKLLEIGKLYIWYFSGIMKLHNMTIPGTVLREEATYLRGMMKRYVVKFDESAQEQRSQLQRFLEERY